MRFLRWIGLFSECYKIAGWTGLRACTKYLFGLLEIDDFSQKCFDLYMGDLDA